MDHSLGVVVAKLMEVQGPEGSTIYIQYEDEDTDELAVAVGVVDDIAERTERFKSFISSTIQGYSAILLDAITSQRVKQLVPSKLAIEFGIQAGGETGVPFVTKGSAQANVKVLVEWELDKSNGANLEIEE